MICLDITEVKKMNNFDERYDERHNEKANNVLGALSYLSVFFAPVLFPLVVWIIAKPPGSTHSRNALFNHIFTWVFVAIELLSLMSIPALLDSAHSGIGITIAFIVAAIFFIWAIVLFFTNIIRGIKLLII